MQRKKILWLTSWYPNRNDKFDGDFIQRHARAASIYHDVHVIYVNESGMNQSVEEVYNYATGLTEQIIYFKKRKGFSGRIQKQLTWRKLYKKAIKKYVDNNGVPDGVHVHVPWKAALIALWMKKKYGKEFIITEHWGIYNRVVDDNIFNRPKWMQSMLKKIFSEAKIFISVSQFLANSVQQITGRNADYIIPNVVDTTLFFCQEEKYSKFTFIHVSNMAEVKNVKGILDAFKKLVEKCGGEFQLIMIGNRDDKYVKYANEIGLLNTSVFFRGEVSYRQVAEEMQRSHCFVLNSLMENSPCVIGEALCCGLPVIATNVGGVSELVNENNGILVPPAEIGALAQAMECISNNYSSFIQNDIANEAAKKFSYNTVSKKFDELYTLHC